DYPCERGRFSLQYWGTAAALRKRRRVTEIQAACRHSHAGLHCRRTAWRGLPPIALRTPSVPAGLPLVSTHFSCTVRRERGRAISPVPSSPRSRPVLPTASPFTGRPAT